jgi:hypothetical protein
MLAIYALLLHGPSMAAFGPGSARTEVVSIHAGHGAAAGAVDASKSTTCCWLCGGGACAVGPGGPGVPYLPPAVSAARRVERRRLRQPPPLPKSCHPARGPPQAA